MAAAFQRRTTSVRHGDLLTDAMTADFGDWLRLHHFQSDDPFTKEKFEWALSRTLTDNGVTATRSLRCFPGHDVTRPDTRYSLKTEAAKSIRRHRIHISKAMELGGGVWGDNPADLIGLRHQFLTHLAKYDSILILRCLGTDPWTYELVEIDSALLARAADGRLEMRTNSRQWPKPGYCTVEDAGQVQFRLYFDGGGERKLQIKDLDKSLCRLQAEWILN